MSILCVSTASGSPELLRQQILNYNRCMNERLVHVIHVSEEFNSYLNSNLSVKKSILQSGNVYLFTRVKTKFGMIFHAMLQGVFEALKNNLKFDYVYFHTSSDLLFKKDLDLYINNFDVGSARAHILSENDYWYERVVSSKVSSELMASLELRNRLKVRSEGCFFRREIFFEMIFPILTHLGTTDIERVPNYPVEEVEFAWAIESYCEKNKVDRVANVVRNLVGQKRVATVDDINAAEREHGVFGMKRFSSERFDVARKFLFDKVGLDGSFL